MNWRDFFKIGPFLTPRQKKAHFILNWIIIGIYIVVQMFLLQFVRDDWVFVICSVPIVFSGILLGPYSALLTGLLLTVYIGVMKGILTPDHDYIHNFVGISINFLITLLGMMAGWYSDMFHKGKCTEKELIKAREQAEEANQAKSAFLANISHEIRTPLNAMIAYTTLVLDDEADARKTEWLKNILASGRMLMNLTSDLLNLSRIEAGVLKPQYQPLQLKRLLDDIHSIFQLKAKEKNLDFSIINNNGPEWFLGDLKMIQQILVNLIGNAVKFTLKGFVILECQPTDRGIFFHIKDSGIGIPQEEFNKIFKAFAQVNQEKGLKSKGTGLGLSITQQLVFLLGGDISVDSQLDVGSCFTVWIPFPDNVADTISKTENPGIKVEQKIDVLSRSLPLYELGMISKKKIIAFKPQFLVLIKKLSEMEGLFSPSALKDLVSMVQYEFPEDIAQKLVKPIKQTLVDFDDQRISSMLSQLRELYYE
ncbi:MAG: hypothetical protein JXR70_09830 [Spirochaetales bacterium]|nr:hypothetical protein [Spirochaetales bacterium]